MSMPADEHVARDLDMRSSRLSYVTADELRKIADQLDAAKDQGRRWQVTVHCQRPIAEAVEAERHQAGPEVLFEEVELQIRAVHYPPFCRRLDGERRPHPLFTAEAVMVDGSLTHSRHSSAAAAIAEAREWVFNVTDDSEEYGDTGGSQ